jgi:hypothetical protein
MYLMYKILLFLSPAGAGAHAGGRRARDDLRRRCGLHLQLVRPCDRIVAALNGPVELTFTLPVSSLHRIGNKAWTKALPWTGHASFESEEDHTWYYTDATTGSTTAVAGGMARTAPAQEGAGSLTFLQVYEAGHMVPMDQPAAALALLNGFLNNKPFY